MAAKSEEISLTVTDGGSMGAYISRPAAEETRGGIIVLQDAMGVNSGLRALADRYAQIGLVAIAPDLFHRVSPGFQRTSMDVEAVMPLVRALTTDGLIADISAAHEWLVSHEGITTEHTACVGFCLGGRATFIANSVLPLGAAISYYGGSIAPALLDRAPSLHGRHLFIWGGKDTGIPAEQRRAVIDAVAAAEKPFVDVVFSECNHGFCNRVWTERYVESAEREAWALGTAFLENALGIELVR